MLRRVSRTLALSCCSFLVAPVLLLSPVEALTGATAAFPLEIPELVYEAPEGHERPIWVAAQAIDLDPTTVSQDHWRDILDWNASLLVKKEAEGCSQQSLRLSEIEIAADPGAPPRRSVHADVHTSYRSAHWIGLGVIVDSASGFSGVTPGSLLQVSFTEALKGPVPSEDRLLFYPAGQFTFQDHDICVEAPELPPLPKKGQRVLIFSLDLGSGILWDWNQLSVISFDGAGRAITPAWLSSSAMSGKPLEEILGALIDLGGRDD